MNTSVLRNDYNNLIEDSSEVKNKKNAEELLQGFSKRTIVKWFISFLEEECSGIGFDIMKVKQLINRLHKYYHKKDSVHDIQFLLDNITSFFLDDTFREKIKDFIERHDDKINEYGKDFFYEKGVFSCNNLERTIIAKIKRHNLSFTAINELSKKEILDVLQINNRFKDNENINRRIIDVQGRGKNKIYILQDNKRAKMIDGKLVLQDDDSAQDVHMMEKEEYKDMIEEKMGDKEMVGINDREEMNQEIAGRSGKKYQKTNKMQPIKWIGKGIHILDEGGRERWLPLADDGTIVDVCIANDGKNYEIVEHISATQNTAHMNVVRIKDHEGKEKNVRLLTTIDGDYLIQKEVFMKKSISRWIRQNKLIQYIYKICKKKCEENKALMVEDFCWDGEKGYFKYTLANGKEINMEKIVYVG